MNVQTIAAGIFFYSTTTKRFLYLLRAIDKNANSNNWGLPGGKIEKNETLYAGLERECMEELDYFPHEAKLIPIQKFVNNSFVYHTFFCKLEKEFIPKLNEEHIGYCWIDRHNFPKPLHPGLFNTVNFEIVKEKLEKLLSKIE